MFDANGEGSIPSPHVLDVFLLVPFIIHTDMTRGGIPLLSVFLSTQTPREGVPPFSACFHPPRCNKKGYPPSCCVFPFFFLISDHPTVDNAMRRVRHERSGFNTTLPVFDVFGVVSTPPHSFSTAFNVTRVQEGGTTQDVGIKGMPTNFFPFCFV